MKNKIKKLYEIMKITDKNLRDIFILKMIQEEENFKVIQEELELSKQNLSYHLEKLVHLGYIIKDKCTKDNRVVVMALTEEGEIYLRNMEKLIEGVEM